MASAAPAIPLQGGPTIALQGGPSSLLGSQAGITLSDGGFGIQIPLGDPAALEQAAGRWSGMADVLANQAAQVRRDATAVTATKWSGQAGLAFLASVTTMCSWMDNAVGGCHTAATGCRKLAAALRDAQHAAKTAIGNAQEADNRQQVAAGNVAQAHSRANDAQQAMSDAASRLLSAQAAGPSGASAAHTASTDHTQAQIDLTNAQTDAQRATQHQDAAAGDLHSAQANGGTANQSAQDAARAASAAFSAATDQLTTTVCLAAPPAPIDPARPAAPNLLLGAPGLAGLSPFPHSPADMRRDQIVQERAAAQAEAEREQEAAEAAAQDKGSLLDSYGGEFAGLTGFHLWGNKNTQVYETSEKVGNVLGYLPTPAAIESIGGRILVKEGAHLAEKDVANQGEKAIVKEGAGGATAEARTGAGWRGTNMSDEKSFAYHYGEHGEGRTAEQYAHDAQAWATKPSGVGVPVKLADGTTGVRYRTPGGGPGGILDSRGNIVTFWYR